MVSSRWALLSAYDKEGLTDFCRKLLEYDYRLIASGGTARHLGAGGLEVDTVSSHTGWDELLQGRVKTIHPKVLAGILARRDSVADMDDLEVSGAVPIDMVVVNLYPFEDAVGRSVPEEEALEMIDVGGLTLLRAAAKNWPHVSVVTHPNQYSELAKEVSAGKGAVSSETRRRLAVEAFALTSRYEVAIYNYLWRAQQEGYPPQLRIAYPEASRLRYGENPYQRASFYRDPSYKGSSVAASEDLFGRGLSFNNILDLDAALELVMKFDRPTVAIIKHTSASGVASSDSLAEAYRLARECDPKSAYGCVVGFNRAVDEEVAAAMKKHFVEAVIAPDFEDAALGILRGKKKLRVLRTGREVSWEPSTQILGVRGGVLIQSKERVVIDPKELKCPTKAEPTEEQMEGLLFANKVLGHVKSNAIVLAKRERTVGIGSGQMSRVDSVIVAGLKAGEEAAGSVLASDAFFPFRDGIDEAAKVGVEAIIQPGGSIRDQEVIDSANEYGMAMVFTGLRVFKH